MYFVDKNLEIDFYDDNTLKALKFTTPDNTFYIRRKSDALFLLHILKTFVKKRLKKEVQRSVYFSNTEEVIDPPKTADIKLKELRKYKYCEGVMVFSKFSENNQTYLKMQCDTLVCDIYIYKVLESFTDNKTKQKLVFKRQSKKPCGFELTLSEFKAEFYIEVLSRIRYF